MKEYATNIRLCSEAIGRLCDRISENEQSITKTMEVINIDMYTKDGESLKQLLNRIQAEEGNIAEDIGYLRKQLKKMITLVYLLTAAADKKEGKL